MTNLKKLKEAALSGEKWISKLENTVREYPFNHIAQLDLQGLRDLLSLATSVIEAKDEVPGEKIEREEKAGWCGKKDEWCKKHDLSPSSIKSHSDEVCKKCDNFVKSYVIKLTSLDVAWNRCREEFMPIYLKQKMEIEGLQKRIGDICDAFHEAEKQGYDLPKVIENWWINETDIMTREQSHKGEINAKRNL